VVVPASGKRARTGHCFSISMRAGLQHRCDVRELGGHGCGRDMLSVCWSVVVVKASKIAVVATKRAALSWHGRCAGKLVLPSSALANGELPRHATPQALKIISPQQLLGSIQFGCRQAIRVIMDPTRQFTDRLGVTVDSKSSYLLVAVLLVAGTFALAAPFISFIRVLLSLFILPGKSVSCHVFTTNPWRLTSIAIFFRSPRLMGSDHRCQRWHW
jgi:hypothetical protein